MEQEYNCDQNCCGGSKVLVERRICKFPRELIVCLKRHKTILSRKSNLQKREDSVDIGETLELSQFCVGRRTVVPDMWHSRDCIVFLPPRIEPSEKKRPRVDGTEGLPEPKRLRTGYRGRHDRGMDMSVLAAAQRNLMGQTDDVGLLIALMESMHGESAGGTDLIDQKEETDEHPDPNNFKPWEGEKPRCTFKLWGTIHHHGGDVSCGHYTARVLVDRTWQLHNDERVKRLDEELAFGDEECETVYMYFYEWLD